MTEYRCCDCGAIFDEESVGTSHESRGEYWGVPCYEDVSVCPECGSDCYEEYFEEDEDDDEGE